MMNWPDEVWILDLSWSKISKRHSHHDTSLIQWMYQSLEWFRNEIKDTNDEHAIKTMCSIFQYRWNCIVAIQSKYPNTYNMLDVYNATLYSMGYCEGMNSKAQELCLRRFHEPYSGVFNV